MDVPQKEQMESIDGLKIDTYPKNDSAEDTQSHNAPGASRKRVYQSRRNSRACDACRSRKTKCDAPATGASGPCTSCASASLLCKFTETVEGKKIGPVRRLRMLETTIGELNEKLRRAEAQLQSPATSVRGSYSPRNPSPRSPTPAQPRRFSSSSSGESITPGATSTLGFVQSVQGYMEGLGYDTSLLDTQGSKLGKLQSTSPSPYDESLQIRDLRALLPTKENGEKLLAIFHRYIIRYTPVMCWSVIYSKFERAYRAPILAEDQLSATGIFCVLMAINAYASICSDDTDIFEVPNYSSKRGWYFLEFAKNFHNLHRPNHSIFDVEVLVIMAMYLEVVGLPYHLRLTMEYLAKVCRELGLHRKLAYGKFKLRPIELEHRSRLFWCAFLLDRRLALQFGTAPIFDEDDIDIDEPGSNDISDLIENESDMTGLRKPACILAIRSLIATSRCIGPIFRLNPQTESAEHHVDYIEQQLSVIESGFPKEILTWEGSDPLDPILLDAAVLAMATRLSLYRFFTDDTLSSGFRTRCFMQCLEVAKVTVHLLRRMMSFPDWEKIFHLRQYGLTYQHIFKISTILLLAASIFPKPLDTSSELRSCIGVLQVAASNRPVVLQSLHILDKVAEILKQKPIIEWCVEPGSECPVIAPEGIDDSTGYPLGMNFLFAGGIPAGTTASPTMPSIAPRTVDWTQVPVVIQPKEVSLSGSNKPLLGPNYKFPNLTSSYPSVETNTWLNQVDSSSWTLMQNVLQRGELR